MNIHNVSLTISAVRPNQYPTTGYMEFAFAGRSNVGKSSMINKLLNRKSLARVSGTRVKQLRLIFIISTIPFILLTCRVTDMHSVQSPKLKSGAR